ncbi:MAG: Nif3-like dinuclear metal center hexameric protein [Planctomycetaceae bacterium]
MTTIREICQFLNEVAPLAIAESWDNVGLLLGDNKSEVSVIVTCLTLTPDVVDEAVAAGAQMVVTHHPLLFKPVQKLTNSTSEGRSILKLLRSGIAVYSPHTAYDNAPTGINQQLAELFELSEIAPLRRSPPEAPFKIVTYVPRENVEQVRRGIWDAGAGVIGNYRDCSFNVDGIGTFFGEESTHPAVGQSGRLEQVAETRIEVVCRANRLDAALAALRKAHPYEEPAIDVFPIQQLPGMTGVETGGAGRFGRLPRPMSLEELNHLVSERLRQPKLQFVGKLDSRIEFLGVACGAAGEYLRDAHRAGCQAFLTGETRFHSCLEARDLEIAIILPGHYATERPAMEELARRLTQRFANVAAVASRVETDPVQSL